MPVLTLTTSIHFPDENLKSFLKEFSAFAAGTLHKPEGVLMVNYIHNQNLIFQGSFEPAFLLHIVSLGNLSSQLNEGYSKTFAGYFSEKLGISDGRGYIVFEDPGAAYMGYKSTTVETIFKNMSSESKS